MGNRYHIIEPRFFCCSDIILPHFFHATYKLVINKLFANLSNTVIYAARHHYLTSQSSFFYSEGYQAKKNKKKGCKLCGNTFDDLDTYGYHIDVDHNFRPARQFEYQRANTGSRLRLR
jgi:hypothetical protein